MTRYQNPLIAAAILALLAQAPVHAQQLYKNPEEAVGALAAAAKSGDVKTIEAILGPGSREIVASGDEVADRSAREAFLAAYETKHQTIADRDKAVLLIGQDEWPFPIPLVRQNDRWKFDVAAGREEVLMRRIGRNELSAIQVCLAYVAAQDEYATLDPQKDAPRGYAQRIVSSAGKKDGLYWPAQSGDQQSPLGELAAAAAAEGYKAGSSPTPFHGYYYKVLKAQGPKAPGGAFDYVVRGNMMGGFALVAYPAQYGNSGVMTFLVNHQGVIFQKDLGPATAQIASQMTAFNPDQTWTKVAAEDLVFR
jgi:hypothetical protein